MREGVSRARTCSKDHTTQQISGKRFIGVGSERPPGGRVGTDRQRDSERTWEEKNSRRVRASLCP